MVLRLNTWMILIKRSVRTTHASREVEFDMGEPTRHMLGPTHLSVKHLNPPFKDPRIALTSVFEQR